MNKKKIIVAIIVLIIDQLTKMLMEDVSNDIVIIKDYFTLSYAQNTGAAWSFLAGKTTVLIIITIAMLILVYKLSHSYKENELIDLSFGLLYGGILGNLIDRTFFGYVRDFISVRIINYNFPIFNIADSAIVIAVVFLLYDTVFGGKKNDSISRRRKTNR